MTVPTFDINTVPEKDRQRVAEMIPEAGWADVYIKRMPNGVDDFELIDRAIERKHNILLWGPTGSAKSFLFRAYAASRQLPFVAVEFNASMDRASILGHPLGVDPTTGQVIWEDGELSLVVRFGGVVVFEEANMTSGRITAGFHQLLRQFRMSLPDNNETLWAGHGGTGEPQPFIVAATFNPRYEGTSRLNQAFRNRFAIKLFWDYSPEAEAAILKDELGVESPTLAALAANIRTLEAVKTDFSTNAIMEFVEHAFDHGMEFANEQLVMNFEPGTEQGAVRAAAEAEAANIARELGIQFTVSVSASDEEDPF